MKNILLFLLSLHLYADIPIPTDTKQLLVVSADDFNSSKADLQAYEKEQGIWTEIFDNISVNIGRSGLAWGKGLIAFSSSPHDPVKKEGDGKSPAGLFSLKSFFGYEKRSFNFAYLQVSSSTLCIDESASTLYNHVIQREDPSEFKSFEYMRREDDLYKLGIIVGHNQEGLKRGGSCIFIHIQKEDDASTAGCTAMKEEELLRLMKWLDKSKKPLLLQLPQTYLEEGFN